MNICDGQFCKHSMVYRNYQAETQRAKVGVGFGQPKKIKGLWEIITCFDLLVLCLSEHTVQKKHLRDNSHKQDKPNYRSKKIKAQIRGRKEHNLDHHTQIAENQSKRDMNGDAGC